MSEHINKLTNAELERLSVLAEECGELIQAINKIIRHGYDSYDPTRDHCGNRIDLSYEAADVTQAIKMINKAGDTNYPSFERRLEERPNKLKRYLHYQPKSILK